MVVGLDSVGGDFVLPATRPRRILFVSGGSGITPVMSMLRTLRLEGFTGEIAFLHYARSADEACYRDELAPCPASRCCTATPASRQGRDLDGPVRRRTILPPRCRDPDAVFVCGPPALVAAVRGHCDNVSSESFVPPVFNIAAETSGGSVTFADSGVEVTDDGRPLLDQAEAAGLTPESGCRMGICHTCTRRKTRGAVSNLITGAVSSTEEEDVQICVSVPVGDVDLAL